MSPIASSNTTAAGPICPGGTYSETYPTHDDARAAAVRVSREQRVPDETASIEYATADGTWVTERADGHDRPITDVEG